MSESETVNGTQLHITYNALIVLCAMALFFLLLSWAIGGYDFYNSLMGNYAMSILFGGIATGIALKFACRRRRQMGNGGSTTATLSDEDGSTQGLA